MHTISRKADKAGAFVLGPLKEQTMEELQLSLRKHQHTLSVAGMGVIGFGVWGVLKGFLYIMFVNPLHVSVYTEYENAAGSQEGGLAAYALAIVLIVLVNVFDLRFRWKIGTRAIEISRGEKLPTAGFYVRTMLVTIVDLAEFVLGVLILTGVIPSEEDLADRLSTLLMDLTSVVMLLQMIVAAVLVGKITKKLAKKAAEEQAIEEKATAEDKTEDAD